MTINEHTKIGLFSMLGVMPFICAIVFWVATLAVKVEMQKDIDLKQDTQINSSLLVLMDIREKLIRLEAQADNKKERR